MAVPGLTLAADPERPHGTLRTIGERVLDHAWHRLKMQVGQK